MESHGAQGQVHISEEFKSKIINTDDFDFERRGEIDIKGKGKMITYFLKNNS